ncbi:MAG: hypothetical protein JSR17_13115 [Proteobacteria bacterium]|nr:hypothetical protein [Pseudomonadota bacterium]
MLALQRLLDQQTEEEKQKLADRRARKNNPMNWLVDFARRQNGDFTTAGTTFEPVVTTTPARSAHKN